MKRKGFDELINEHVAQARAQGLRRPVITLLFFDSLQAQAVWADLNGQPPPPAWTEEAGQFTVQAFTVAGAIRLLRKHAGLGGAAVARLLARPPSRPEFWVLWLAAEHLAIAAFIDGDLAFESSVEYDRLEFEARPQRPTGQARPSQQLATAGGVHALDTEASLQQVARTAYLVRIVAGRCLPTGTDGKMVDLPIGDDELALVLKDSYADAPSVVAAAILKLRTLKGHKDRWLLRVLEGRRDLRKLAKPVLAKLAKWPARVATGKSLTSYRTGRKL